MRNLWMVAAAALMALTGCQNKFTQAQYDAVSVGQADWQVQQVLGEPHQRRGDKWVYVHDRPYYRAEILFQDDKVASKCWSTSRPYTPPPNQGYRPGHTEALDTLGEGKFKRGGPFRHPQQ